MSDSPAHLTSLVAPFVGTLVEKLTPAQLSLKTLNDAIALTDPKMQMEIKYVEERLHFLLNRHGEAAIYALMRANLQVTVEAGK